MKNLIFGCFLLLASCGGDVSDSFKTGNYKLVDAAYQTPIMVRFAPDGQFSGKIVNNMMGKYKLGSNNNISFEPIATTMMMGPDNAMKEEQSFLQILPLVKSYKIEQGNLILQTSDNQTLIFEPLSN